MGALGFRAATGIVSNSVANPYGNANWSVIFGPAQMGMGANRFEIYHIAISGPTGSSVQVFVDRSFYDATPAGWLNSWDPNEPLLMDGGQTLFLYYNTATAPAPFATIWLRTPKLL